MRNNKNKSYTSITNSLKNGIYEIDKHLYSTTKRNWGLMHIYLDINIDDIDTFHIFPLARITMHFTYRKKGTDNNDRMVGESVILHLSKDIYSNKSFATVRMRELVDTVFQAHNYLPSPTDIYIRKLDIQFNNDLLDIQSIPIVIDMLSSACC